MNRTIERFISEFLKEIEEDNAAIFAGAGLSAASGHVDWRGLLEDIAVDLELDIQKEYDLISLAQYHLNKNLSNRYTLNQIIANEFHHGKSPNVNHKILAKLPISTFWTTNYDKLLEKALEQENKIVDIKYTTTNLAQTIHGRDVILYKMHGDVEHPNDAIISKDQYEKYHNTHGAFINTLAGDLTSKTFLFIGFSFTDPNLDYVLSRIRATYQDNQRKHYCFLREVKQQEKEEDEDFNLRKIKQALFISDLLRFNIHVILLSEYTEITDILKEIQYRFKRRTVYISGSAHTYGKWPVSLAETFISDLSKELVKNNFKIVSGFGLGVGSFVISGVLEEIYLNRKQNLKDQLLLRPFPQGEKGKMLWDDYRKDMISYAGISIFIFGNKLKKEEIISADGVRREFEICLEQNLIVLPIGVTGFVAKELWSEVLDRFKEIFKNDDLLSIYKELGNEGHPPEKIISLIINFLNKLLNK
ncbi:MAG: SIR2 family protein [Ginsengibacter sp.]